MSTIVFKIKKKLKLKYLPAVSNVTVFEETAPWGVCTIHL